MFFNILFPITQFAGLETETNTIHRTCGAEAHIDIYQPTVDHGKFSAAAVMVQSGGPGMLGTARAGWMVYTTLSLHAVLTIIYNSHPLEFFPFPQFIRIFVIVPIQCVLEYFKPFYIIPGKP